MPPTRTVCPTLLFLEADTPARPPVWRADVPVQIDYVRVDAAFLEKICFRLD